MCVRMFVCGLMNDLFNHFVVFYLDFDVSIVASCLQLLLHINVLFLFTNTLSPPPPPSLILHLLQHSQLGKALSDPFLRYSGANELKPTSELETIMSNKLDGFPIVMLWFNNAIWLFPEAMRSFRRN